MSVAAWRTPGFATASCQVSVFCRPDKPPDEELLEEDVLPELEDEEPLLEDVAPLLELDDEVEEE